MTAHTPMSYKHVSNPEPRHGVLSKECSISHKITNKLSESTRHLARLRKPATGHPYAALRVQLAFTSSSPLRLEALHPETGDACNLPPIVN